MNGVRKFLTQFSYNRNMTDYNTQNISIHVMRAYGASNRTKVSIYNMNKNEARRVIIKLSI